jgi:hypothetical protein
VIFLFTLFMEFMLFSPFFLPRHPQTRDETRMTYLLGVPGCRVAVSERALCRHLS